MYYLRNQTDELQITYDRDRKLILAVGKFQIDPPKVAGSFFMTGTREDLMAFFTGRGYDVTPILNFVIEE